MTEIRIIRSTGGGGIYWGRGWIARGRGLVFLGLTILLTGGWQQVCSPNARFLFLLDIVATLYIAVGLRRLICKVLFEQQQRWKEYNLH